MVRWAGESAEHLEPQQIQITANRAALLEADRTSADEWTPAGVQPSQEHRKHQNLIGHALVTGQACVALTTGRVAEAQRLAERFWIKQRYPRAVPALKALRRALIPFPERENDNCGDQDTLGGDHPAVGV